jgi:hypothetical protein
LLTRLVPADLSGRATLNYEAGSFRYELEAPVEAVVEQVSKAVVAPKEIIPTVPVICRRPDAKELSA